MSSPVAAVARFARVDCTAAALLAAGPGVVVAWVSPALLKRCTVGRTGTALEPRNIARQLALRDDGT
jgi:hypothetical protein